MLTSLEIQNFQSHKLSNLHFSPGVNIIIGPSDSGKTAILRALRWLFYNQPLRNSFCSSWGGETSVGLWTDSGLVIRNKSKTRNSYIYNDDTFKAMGTSVPEEIQNHLNISKTNFQEQLDRPFLLDNNPGEVAVHFNRLAKLDVIDNANQNIQKWIRDIQGKIKSRTFTISTMKQDLVKFENLDSIEEKVELLEELENRKISLFVRIQKLNSKISAAQSFEKEEIQLKEKLKIEPALDKVLDIFQEKQKLKEKITELLVLTRKIEGTLSNIKYLNRLIGLDKKVEKVLRLTEKRKGKLLKIGALEKIMDLIVSAQEKEDGFTYTLAIQQELFDKEMPDICPLCGRKTK